VLHVPPSPHPTPPQVAQAVVLASSSPAPWAQGMAALGAAGPGGGGGAGPSTSGSGSSGPGGPSGQHPRVYAPAFSHSTLLCHTYEPMSIRHTFYTLYLTWYPHLLVLATDVGNPRVKEPLALSRCVTWPPAGVTPGMGGLSAELAAQQQAALVHRMNSGPEGTLHAGPGPGTRHTRVHVCSKEDSLRTVSAATP
jgi:hypothetical protein